MSRHWRLVAAVGVLLVTWLPVASAALAGEPSASQVAAIIESYRAKGVADGVVLVAVRGRPVDRLAFGLANREQSLPTTPDARYRIGSITKQFTAAAILQLAEAHKLSLDDPVTR